LASIQSVVVGSAISEVVAFEISKREVVLGVAIGAPEDLFDVAPHPLVLA
jgi:hypothetical protein